MSLMRFQQGVAGEADGVGDLLDRLAGVALQLEQDF